MSEGEPGRSRARSLEVLAAAGLCRRCDYAGLKTTTRTTFVRCSRSDTDRRFPRYPLLPVLVCTGFREARREDGEAQGEGPGSDSPPALF